MKHRVLAAVALTILILCALGSGPVADPGIIAPAGPWIKFDSGSPNGNKPGGVANRLEGKGTYDTGGGVVVSLDFAASQGKFNAVQNADYLNGNWGATMKLVPGQYLVAAVMTTTTDGKNQINSVTDAGIVEVK